MEPELFSGAGSKSKTKSLLRFTDVLTALYEHLDPGRAGELSEKSDVTIQ